MFWRGSSGRVLACAEPVEMRKGFHGLISLARNVLNEDALSGDIYTSSIEHGQCCWGYGGIRRDGAC